MTYTIMDIELKLCVFSPCLVKIDDGILPQEPPNKNSSNKQTNRKPIPEMNHFVMSDLEFLVSR